MSTAVAYEAPRSVLAVSEKREKWGRLEWFMVAVLLSSGLLFLPGSTIIRAPVRGLPYAMSLAFLFWHLSARSRRVVPAAGILVLPALVLYGANLVHPLTEPTVGIATALFHLAVAAPVFWAGALVRDVEHLEKLLLIVFGAAILHVIMGMLQTVNPMLFMPPEIAANPNVLVQQTYYGPFGQLIVRPLGLTDIPGGASMSGALAGVLGIAFLLRPGERGWLRVGGLFFAVAGLFVLYLTQVRAFAVSTVFALIVFVAIAFMHGRGRLILAMMFGLGILAFLAGLEGFGYDPTNPYAPAGRFQELLDEGLVDAYMQNRGIFLEQTFNEYLFKYPLGAGLGRWGMMREYFGSGSPFSAIWVEIQPTGWLLDGGIPMWIFYGGGILAAMFFTARVALKREAGDIAYFAAIVLAIQCVITGSMLAGPVFNTVYGILFWLLTAILYAAYESIESKPGERSASFVRSGFS